MAQLAALRAETDDNQKYPTYRNPAKDGRYRNGLSLFGRRLNRAQIDHLLFRRVSNALRKRKRME